MSRQKGKIYTNTESFICGYCGSIVTTPESGTKNRNHCPHCLYSRHVDTESGDRRSDCQGLMEPIGVWVKKNKEWAIIHRCQRCGFVRTNRIAADDNEIQLFSLAVQPVTQLPFPANIALKQIKNNN